jgi:hexosaminidase
VVEWARLHAVRVLPEIDIPGHASSWCKGYPEVCPSDDCKTPLNPVMPTRLTPDATDATFELISRLFDDVCSMFPDALLHLGHDEVDTSCWDKTPLVTEWLLKNDNMTSQQALEHFLLRSHYMAASHGRTVVAWDEVWDVLGRHLPTDTVVQQWRWGCPHCDVNVGDSVNRTRDITVLSKHSVRVSVCVCVCVCV